MQAGTRRAQPAAQERWRDSAPSAPQWWAPHSTVLTSEHGAVRALQPAIAAQQTHKTPSAPQAQAMRMQLHAIACRGAVHAHAMRMQLHGCNERAVQACASTPSSGCQCAQMPLHHTSTPAAASISLLIAGFNRGAPGICQHNLGPTTHVQSPRAHSARAYTHVRTNTRAPHDKVWRCPDAPAQSGWQHLGAEQRHPGQQGGLPGPRPPAARQRARRAQAPAAARRRCARAPCCWRCACV
jgi:hypothetical protein